MKGVHREMTKATFFRKMDKLKDYVERQSATLKSIKKQSFKDVIDSEETYEEWLKYELETLFKMVEEL